MDSGHARGIETWKDHVFVGFNRAGITLAWNGAFSLSALPARLVMLQQGESETEEQ